MHHCRHRSIAGLVKDLEAYDRQVAAQSTREKTRTATAIQCATPDNKNNDLNHDDESDYEETYNPRIVDETETILPITIPDSAALMPTPLSPKSSSSLSSSGQDLSPATPLKKKDIKKARQVAQLIKKNSQNTVTTSFLEFVAEALHDNKITDKSCAMFEEEDENIGGNQFQNETLMKDNLGFQQFMRNTSQTRQLKERRRKLGPHEKEQELAAQCPVAPGFPRPNFVDIDPNTRFDINFFARLGIKFKNLNDSSKERHEIVVKLANEICADMTIISREEFETQVREAGFWRFVNRTAAHNLHEAHRDFSWATGEFRKRRNASASSDASKQSDD